MAFNCDFPVRLIFENGPRLVSGQKVTAMYHTLLDPTDRSHVALGRLEKRALTQDYASGDECFRISKYEYAWIQKHYEIVAARLDLIPCELQSIVSYVVGMEMAKSQKKGFRA